MASVEELEIIVTKLEELLCKQDDKLLIELTKELNIYTEETEKKSKRTLRKIIEKHFEGIIDDDTLSNDDKKNQLKEIEKMILKESPNAADTRNTEEENVNKLNTEEKEEIKKTSAENDDVNSKHQSKQTPNGKKTDDTDDQNTGEGNKFSSAILRELGMLSPLRKELKIRGQIGEAGQKDKLNYVSLMHQVKQAKLTGYTDQEVINAVISAMIPGLKLRTVLETTSNLSLERLKRFLESHYQQKNAHDLCNTLTNMLQFPEESAYDFVMRCLELRQKILLVSDKSGDLSYSPVFVNKLFLRTLERGIQNPFVVQEIRPMLRSDEVCDEKLLAAIIKASAYEKERAQLQAQAPRKTQTAKVHEASFDKSGKQDDTLTKLMSAVDSLTSKMSSLQTDFNNLKDNKKDYNKNVNMKRRNYVNMKCNVCTKKKIDSCSHCYLCGEKGHYARNCPSLDDDQGN